MVEAEWTFGIKLHKSQASHAIKILKSSNLLSADHKIAQQENYVLIPIKAKPVKNLPEFDYEIIQHEFETTSKTPSSMQEAIIKLDPDIDIDILPTSFEQVGDIAIIDLKEEMEDYKELVGEAILLFNPSISTVYNKANKVQGQFRLRELELIGGIEKTKTVHKEYGLKIHTDIKKVYFSSRLSTEHHRVASQVRENELVLDLFGSVAPFGLHITHNKNSKVITVDINPKTQELIQQSIEDNKLIGEIEIIVTDSMRILRQYRKENVEFDRIIMNHPSGADKFLFPASKILKSSGKIYYYTFAPIDPLETYITNHIRQLVPELIIENINIVRQYSPSEYHVCVELIKI